MAAPVVPVSASAKSVVVDGLSFALNGKNVSYRFHVDEKSGDLISDHFGGSVTEDPVMPAIEHIGGWSIQAHIRREFPDVGRGDFRSPAVHIKHAEGHTVSDFKYKSHTIINGKPKLQGLPATFGKESDVTTLVIHLFDEYSSIEANLSYSIFPEHDAITRSIELKNTSDKAVTIERLSSFSIDFPYDDYDMIELQGDWVRECQRVRRKVDYGSQGFASSNGYSSHLYNPFFSIVSPTTTESQGEAWGFSLVYTGSFSAEVQKDTQGLTRALIGLNPLQLSWPLGPGESFTSPECVSVYSNTGIGGMSRKYHHIFQEHLIRSKFVREPRPVLLNSWEGVYFNFDENTVYRLAQETAKLGAKLFVLDDGWFGVKHPRINDHAGLGDWVTNPARFPKGLKPVVEKIKELDVANSNEKLKFGLWVEPEMVNPKSSLYEEHPDWVIHAGNHPRTEARNQLVLNLGLTEVQDFIISSISKILEDAPIDYIKWDNNRGIHETPSPSTDHAYILGLYRVLEELTTRFPNVLWEGCASGGGRFDPGILYYFPQNWTSDNTDAHDRIHIQFGTSLVYPPSTMGAHVSAVPNHVTRRITPVRFRAHVAMMGGSFGLELNPDEMPDEDKKEILELIALAEKINPIVIRGDMYRLTLPSETNYPAALFISEDAKQAALFVFQIRATTVHNYPKIRLQGLDPAASYKIDGGRTVSGTTLMNGGFVHKFGGDYDSTIVFLEKI